MRAIWIQHSHSVVDIGWQIGNCAQNLNTAFAFSGSLAYISHKDLASSNLVFALLCSVWRLFKSFSISYESIAPTICLMIFWVRPYWNHAWRKKSHRKQIENWIFKNMSLHTEDVTVVIHACCFCPTFTLKSQFLYPWAMTLRMDLFA
jgi:hypothetical protein